jgi:hypothetical protein
LRTDGARTLRFASSDTGGGQARVAALDQFMCNLYSLTKGQAVIVPLVRYRKRNPAEAGL